MSLFFDRIRNNWNGNEDKLFIISKINNFTFKEFSNLNNTSSLYINKTNNLLAIQTQNSLELLSYVWNCWKNNFIPVLLNPKWTKVETDLIINEIKLEHTISSEHFPKNNNSDFRTYPNNKDEETAIIIFTSGSSDKPKGVELSFSNLYYSAINGDKILNLKIDNKWLLSIPPYHIGGFSIFTRSLLTECSLIISESFNAETVYKNISEFKPDFISLVTPQIKYFTDNKLTPNENLKLSLLGGGFINDNLINNFLELGWKCATVYGSTETSSFVTINKSENLIKYPTSSGKVVGETTIEIVDEKKNILKPLQSGEIVIKGKSIAKGYYNNENETNIKFKDEKYFSGDFGYLNEEGFLFVEGKRTDLIVTGGENVNPYEIEKVIKQFEGIKDCTIIPLPDEKWGQIVVSVIETEIIIDENRLLTFLKENLASFKIPKKFNYTKSLPRTALGKINRKIIKEEYKSLYIG